MHPVEIDIHEEFPRLSKAPIVEAALDIRARAMGDWEEAGISDALRTQFAEYPHHEGRNLFQGELAIEPGKQPRHELEDLGWGGVVARSGDKKQVAFFERDRFLFNRLESYTRWDAFQAEALRLWNIHRALARPMTLQWVGIFFRNHVPLSHGNMRMEDCLGLVPNEPAEVSAIYTGYLHQDTMTVSGHNYDVFIMRTTQTTSSASWMLIMDVNPFTRVSFSVEEADMQGCLQEMRWLKNKAFLGAHGKKLKESRRHPVLPHFSRSPIHKTMAVSAAA